MSCDGTLIEAPPAQHNKNNNNNNNNITEPRTPIQPKIAHTQVSGGLGSTTLNPEASVFHLPAARQLTPPATPSQPTTHINGFTHHVYPFMNGDVGKQFCGVCPPTPDTPGSLAVDVSLESASVTSSVTSTPLNSSTKSLSAASSVFATPPLDMASNSSPVSSNEPQDSIKEVLITAPIVTSQQNGEVELETIDFSTNTSVTSIPDDSNPLNTTTEIDVVTVDDEVDVGVDAAEASLPSEAPSSTETTPATPQTEIEPAVEASETTTNSLNDASEETQRSVVPEDNVDTQKEAAVKEEAEEANNETQGTQTTPAQSPAPNQPAPEPLSRDQIKALVAQQVEFFFSRENLSNDPYLISQMDSDQYVPVFILAGCSQFKAVTKDHSIIVEALKESPFVQLDEEKNRVRPNYKRCIVILREIPESTPVEEIEAMFKGEECPKLVSCEFVHNSSWYVTFESDEDAQKAYWYLRGVVKTFKDKPILARIKTKPISRLGCLSVLPSYGGKGPGDSKDQPAPPSTPGPGGGQGGPPAPSPQPGTPATPVPPTSSYNPRAPTPYMYPAPPSSVNGPTYPYSYPTATNAMPTAYFYPNMPVWTAPGGFYDINSFLQFNGLSPQAAFKPPPTPHNQGRFNGRRNSKHGRQNDNRQQQNNGGYNGTSGGHSGYHHNQRSQSHSGHSRPQSAQSPSTGGPQGHQAHRNGNGAQVAAASAVSHPQPIVTAATTTTTTTTAASVPQQTTSPAVSTIPANNHNFAQCDLALASQSNLYTSFSPPMGTAAVQNSSIRTDKKDMVSVKAPPMSNSSSNVSSTSSTPPVSTTGPASHTTTHVSPSASSSSMLNTPVAPVAASIAGAASPSSQTVVTSAMPPTQISSQIPPSQHQLQHQQQLQQQQQYPAGPPPPPHHRNAYNTEYHHHPGGPHPHYHHPMQRDHPRQFYQNWGYPRSRGGGRGRRRPREEEEMMGMGPGGRGRGQGPREPPTQLPGSNDMANKSQPQHPDSLGHPHSHFDLEATAFPPLPGASPEEPTAAPVAEERPVEPLPSAWGSSDSQRFSDVMKGTTKPIVTRASSQPSQTSSPGEPIIEIPSPTNQTTQPIISTGFSLSAAPSTVGSGLQTSPPPTTLAAVVTHTQPAPPAPTAAVIVATPTPPPPPPTVAAIVATPTPPPPQPPTVAAIVATPAPPPPPTAAAIVATQPTSQSNTEATNSFSQDASLNSTAHTTTQQSAASNSSSSTSSSSISSNLYSSNSSISSSVNKVDSRSYSQRSAYSRDERRGGAVGGPRGDRREYPRDNIRGPRDYRNVRENSIRGTGKENRPQPSRPWKEDKVDADGWITKGSRAQRDTNRDQQQSQPPQYNQRDKVSESREARSAHLVNGDTTPPPSPKPQQLAEKTSKDDIPAADDQKVSTSQPLNNNDGEHKPSWAMMAKQSKESMEKLSSELKEKEEQEKIKKLRLNTRPQMKPQENYVQREGKPLRRDGPPRENRQSSERGSGTFRPRDSARPKSPK